MSFDQKLYFPQYLSTITSMPTSGIEMKIMIPKCPERGKLMQTEDCFKKDGRVNTCLCFKEKDLLCYEVVSVVKAYNLRRHFDTKRGAKYAKTSLQEKQQIA